MMVRTRVPDEPTSLNRDDARSPLFAIRRGTNSVPCAMTEDARPTPTTATFGGYRVLRPLARGGMAELSLAEPIAGGATVVLKRLLPEFNDRAELVDLFLTEADIGQLLSHDNIVRVLDAGETDGGYFLVMEYVDGLDVARLLSLLQRRHTTLELGAVVRIIADALRGLHFAHTLKSPQGTAFGLVHRDVSPDNLFVDGTGTTKVADFGIAKLQSLEGATQAGLIKGKLSFMSPHQVRGLPLDGRDDGYCLALVAFELLTGVRPFASAPGEAAFDVILRVRKGAVPRVRSVREEVPAAISAVVDRMLRRWRFWRHADCAAFASALEQAARASGVLAGREQVREAMAKIIAVST
jgi:eukaryotic-like serine/threonine-protein kinase